MVVYILLQAVVLLQDYPSLISQAVYTAYCHCFPDSYRQFGEDFKEYLCGLVYGWIAGNELSPVDIQLSSSLRLEYLVV